MAIIRYAAITMVCSTLVLCSTHLAQAQPATATADPAVAEQSDTATQAAAAKLDQLIQGDPYADEAARQINELLDSSSIVVRWKAARAAGRLGLSNPQIVEKLQRGAAHDNWIVQLHSIAALAKTGDKSDTTINALTDAALSPNARVASAAINALRQLDVPPEKLASTFSKVLASNDQAVAVYAVEAMVDAGAKAVPLLKAALKEPNSAFWACVAIQDIGPDAAGTVPDLAAFVKSHDQVESIHQAMMALAAIGPAAKSAEPEINAALAKWSNESAVQLSGMYALGSIGGNGSQDLLAKNAKSDDPFVAMVASWALAKTNPGNDQLTQTAVQRLVNGLKSSNTNMGHAAAHGLATLEIPSGSAAPYLIEAAGDPAAREHVVSALASLGDKAVPHAQKALANPDTRELAVDVLARIGSDAEGTAHALAACMDDAESSVLVKINNVLARIGPAAASATDKLVAELKSSDADVRQSAMYALREIGAAAGAAKDALLKHLHEADVDTAAGGFERLAAAWTLARIAPNDSQLAKSLVPFIQEGLESSSELARRESISAAVDLGKEAAALKGEIAHMAKSDPSSTVRAAAAAATSAMQ